MSSLKSEIHLLQTSETITLHAQFLEIANDISSTLSEAIRGVGPITIQSRADKSLGYFLSRAVVGQQLSIHAARSIWSRIEHAAAGTGLEMPRFFNTAPEEVLRMCGVSRNKIKALKSISEEEGQARLEADVLGKMETVERSRVLLSVWGIGQWTCDMASIFYFNSPDVWPVGDVTVQKTFSRLIGRRNPSRAAERFSPHRSYLALLMWEIVDAAPDR